MIHFTAEMFLGSGPQWQERYARGLAWNTNGIESLKVHEVNPYHLAVPLEKRSKLRQVVYAVHSDFDDSVAEYFFEEDYEKAFAFYRSKHKVAVKLWVAYLKNHDDCPKKTWEGNQNYLNDCHANMLQWSDKFGAWNF